MLPRSSFLLCNDSTGISEGFCNAQQQSISRAAAQLTSQTFADQDLSIDRRPILATVELPESLIDAVDANA